MSPPAGSAIGCGRYVPMRGRFGKGFPQVFLPDCDTARYEPRCSNYIDNPISYEIGLFARQHEAHGPGWEQRQSSSKGGGRDRRTTHPPNGLALRYRQAAQTDAVLAKGSATRQL